jgi:hypothetical protein
MYLLRLTVVASAPLAGWDAGPAPPRDEAMCIPTPLQIFSSPLRFFPLPPPPPCSLPSSADTSETLLVHRLLFLRPQSFDLTIATNKSSQQKQNQTYSLSLSLSLSQCAALLLLPYFFPRLRHHTSQP